MPVYKLIYFDLKGKGETIRLAFSQAGIPFEDFRVKFPDWPALKPKIFTGQLPILEVDGKQLSESTAIARFVAREGGLLGKSSFEQAQIEAVTDAIEGFLNQIIKYKYHSEEAIMVEALHKEIKDKGLPSIISLLETFLGDKQYFVTDKVTLAELHFYSVFSNIQEFCALEWQDKSPKLAALYHSVQKQPRIAEYLGKKP